MSTEDLALWKRRVSAALLNKVKGVAGVGLPAEGVTVYLEADVPEIREAVGKAVKKLKLPVTLRFEVTGTFSRSESRLRSK